MNWVTMGVGGAIGFLSSLGTWGVTRWLERRAQRRISLEWLRVEIERNLDRLCRYQEEGVPEWRGPPLVLKIYFPPFCDEAYKALSLHLPMNSQDRVLVKKAASFYERLHMIQFLRVRFNEREPDGKPESFDNLIRAIGAAKLEGESLLALLEKAIR